MTTEREHTPTTAGERESLRGCLDFHRATLAMKCERAWFRRVIDKQEAEPLYGDFAAAHDATGATREEAFATWQAEIAESRRMVMQHMIQEYARHNGHADLLRQAIDGV